MKDAFKPFVLDNLEPEFDYKKLHDKYLVDLSEDLMLPPTALSIGSHDYKGNLTFLSQSLTTRTDGRKP